MGKFLDTLRAFDAWFERQKRVLPWREEPTLYRVWISEIMLQQTQVVTVIPYFERFLSRFPTVEILAAASEDDVMAHWAGLGYYSRARNLHRGAKKIAAEGFPQTRDAWLEISGVGPYTAGAIASIALDSPDPILDGNVERVLSRVRRVGALRQAAPAATKARLWRLSDLFVKTAHRHGIRPSVLNQALMELGATVCTPKNPRCGACPLEDLCRARACGDAEKFPLKKKAKEWVAVAEKTRCLVDAEGRVLLRKREAGSWRAGLWDLPEELPPAAKKALSKVGSVETKHVVTRHKITRETEVWKVAERGASEREGWRWESLESLVGEDAQPSVAVGSALKRTLSRVLERFPEAVPTRSVLRSE